MGKLMGLDVHAAALGDWVPNFVRISNRMAGIRREPTLAEVGAHRGLLGANALRIENLEQFVRHVSPGAGWRDGPVHAAPAYEAEGDLRADLAIIVLAAETRAASPYRLHRLHRALRPFTDANGRCARALWMWQMLRGTGEDLAEIERLGLLNVSRFATREAPLRSSLM
jgi:hypothetical protein